MADNHNFRIKNGLEVGGVEVITANGVMVLPNTSTATTQDGGTNNTRIATTAFVQQEITTLIGGAPGSLNTLNELAAAINDDASYASTLTTALATKLPLAGGTITSGTNTGLIIDHNTFAKGLEIHRNDTTNAASIVFSNNAGQAGILYATRADGHLRWRPGTTSEANEIWHAGNLTNNQGNWNTAYGWGNHASAGYLTSYTDTNTTYSAGTGISLSGTTFSLTDTNAKLNLSGGTMTGELKVNAPLTIKNPVGTGRVEIGTIRNDQQNGYVRGSIIMSRDEDQITYNGTTDLWVHAGGGSTDWSMISHTNAGTNFYTGPSVSAETTYTNTAFDTAYRWLSVSTSSHVATFKSRPKVGTNNIWHSGDFANNSANWNTAYGWGNHASAGYLAASHDMTLTLSGDATGSATFTNMGNATLSVAIADDSHNHHRLDSTDDRDMKPNTSGITTSVQAIKAFFSSKEGMTGTTGTNYHDVLVLDTYSDSSGGGPNAITFDKGNAAGSPEAYLWKGAWGGTTWGTGQRIFADNYHPNADKWTTARSHTVTLTGEVTGTATQSVDGTGNKTWSIATTLGNTALNDQYIKRGTPSLTSNITTIASSSDIVRWNNTTTGRPASGQSNEYGPMLQMAYEGTRVSQLAHDFEQDNLYFRQLNTSTDTGTTWEQIFHDTYHPNADVWTTARSHTVTLTGDVTGTATQSVNGSGNKTWTVSTTAPVPSAPSITATSVVGETIEVTFSQSSTSGVDHYEVWSDGGSGTDYSLVARVPEEDIASSMSIVDSSFDDGGTIAYRAYAVKNGVYSTAATATRTYTVSTSLDVASLSVVPDINVYHINYNKPASRFIDHIEIYKDAEAVQGNLSRTGAALVYSGANSAFTYSIGASDLDKYHQFWVEVVAV